MREKLREVVVEALQYKTMLSDPDVFCPAARLVEVAISGCSSLAEDLLFLEDVEDDDDLLGPVCYAYFATFFAPCFSNDGDNGSLSLWVGRGDILGES